MTPTYNLCFLGFGNVNRTLVRLLKGREAELRDRHGISWRITGIASRRLGWIADSAGLDVSLLLKPDSPLHEVFLREDSASSVRDWLQTAKADVLFEATSLNVENGQPAIDHIRAALEHGTHAITANKGPIVHAYEPLCDLARAKGRRFLFESTVMDGVPIFSLFRDNLPTVQPRAFHGILNSTTNVILTGMEEGLSFDEALRKAQEIGVAETDASYDIDGWDAAVKVAALIIVLMGAPIKLSEIDCHGIRGLSADEVRAARAAGTPYKLVCRATRTAQGITASVRPERLTPRDPMAEVTGTSSILSFETDIFPSLTITENNPGLFATAYGMLADFITAVGI